jgi:integrase/recombinase XerC
VPETPPPEPSDLPAGSSAASTSAASAARSGPVASSGRPGRRLPRGHLLSLNESFRRTLAAENKSPRTIETYTDAVRLLVTFCEATGRPVTARELAREHIQDFLADQLARWKPSTANNRYRGLHAFFKWAVAEGDLEASPMAGMKPPHVPEQPVEVAPAEQLARLLKTCEGKDFTSRRDIAIILLLVDTGMRRAECAGITLDDVDLDQKLVWVLGKGRRRRPLPIGRRTAVTLDRYLRVREAHKLAHRAELWIGRNGPMTPSGIYQVVHDRARAAGLPDLHPHQLRHGFATSWLAEGGNENELMLVAGWKSRIMVDRYTRATAAERARASHARLSPGDRL